MIDPGHAPQRAPNRDLASVARAFAELHGNVHFLSTTVNGYRDGVARTLAVENQIDVELTADFLIVNGGDDVAADVNSSHASLHDPVPAANSCGSSRAAGSYEFHQQAFLNRQIQRFAEPSVDRQRLHAEKSAVHAAVGDEVVGDILCRVDGNGEADARGGAAGRVDRGINSDHITVRIDEWAAGIAAVNGRVGLKG